MKIFGLAVSLLDRSVVSLVSLEWGLLLVQMKVLTKRNLGGITNGQEMVAAYLREKLPGPVSEAVIAMSDVGEKGINYTTGRAQENAWWLWQILKSVVMGIGKEKKV